jgi:serine/threonine protein kinase
MMEAHLHPALQAGLRDQQRREKKDRAKKNHGNMLLDPEAFHKEYKHSRFLASGTDGEVAKWSHNRIPGRCVAVKTTYATPGSFYFRSQSEALKKELEVLRIISRPGHPNIVGLLGWQDAVGAPWEVYYEYCELGSAAHYGDNLRSELTESADWIPEETVWKLFLDMSRGLHYIHDEMADASLGRLTHGDFKPCNILVTRSESDPTGTLNWLPTFKIADFGRASWYKTSHQLNEYNEWNGTPEYAPPRDEIKAMPPTPAMDIWSLGATIQDFALGIRPVQSIESFCQDFLKENGVDLLAKASPIDFHDQKWRKKIQVKVRPLNVAPDTMRQLWDWPVDAHEPQRFSDDLNRWYVKCMERDPKKRITAKYFNQFLVPYAENQIKVIRAKRAIARSLRDEQTLEKETQQLEMAKKHVYHQISQQPTAPPRAHLPPRNPPDVPPPIPLRRRNAVRNPNYSPSLLLSRFYDVSLDDDDKEDKPRPKAPQNSEDAQRQLPVGIPPNAPIRQELTWTARLRTPTPRNRPPPFWKRQK